MSKITKTIYYHDTDCGGVVYYANYLKYFEEARTEYMRERGVNLEELSKKGINFCVRRVEINYRFPARYADTLEILTKIGKLKSASLEFIQEAKVKNQSAILALTSLACVDKNFSPCLIPENIVAALKTNSPR